MARYIKIDKVEDVLRELMFDLTKHRGGYKYLNEDCKAEYDRLENILDILIKIEPAHVKEVVYGEWRDYLPSPDWVRDDGKSVFLECSECHKAFCRNFFPEDSRNFCPNCGADMRGVE